MNHFSKLEPFPLGAIHAEGFIKDQMLLGKDGMAGHLYELEPGMIADPFINKTYVKRWGDGDQSGWGAEISGNYWTGYIEHAFVLNDKDMISRATEWVDTMMKKQREDGYLGTYYEKDAKIYEDYNAWGTSCAMRGLIAFYEATKREDVLTAVYRCMLWFCENWAGDRKTLYAGPSIIEPMVYCYRYTGDKRLIDFAEDYAEFQAKNDLFNNSYKTFLEGDYQYNSNHTAAMGVASRLPALLYSVTGKEKYLKATERIVKNTREHSVHITGAPVSMNEFLGPVGSVAESEYCNFAFYNATYFHLSYITGEAKYGEYMEEMFYNATQGARKKDEKAIAYLSSPNQLYATTDSSPTMRDMQVYAPCYPVACCPVNAVAVVPEFVRGMMLRDEKENIYAAAYGPCSLEYSGIKITEKTLYPFRNRVEFEIDADKEFSIFLRIPEWCSEYTVQVNSKNYPVSKNGSGYAEIAKHWKKGDILRICFKTEVQVLRIDDSDASKKYPIAIKYGALVFSYQTRENWVPIQGTPETELPEGWSWYNVYSSFDESDHAADPHEVMGKRKFVIDWNFAVDENLKNDEIEIEEIEEKGYVWSNPTIKLHIPAYKALYLCAPYPCTTLEPFGDRQTVGDKLEIELVPYGCTNLRITYFPRADLKS